jgi:hypothetical protein
MNVKKLAVGTDGRMSPLKFTLVQSDEAYTQISRVLPCQLYFMLVAELGITVSYRGEDQSFSYSVIWREAVDNASIDHREIVDSRLVPEVQR